MADEILPIQPRIEAVRARLPQITAGLDPRRHGGPLAEPAAAFRLAPPDATEPPRETPRRPLDPALTQHGSLRRFSSSLPVTRPAEIEAPARSNDRALRNMRDEAEDIGEKTLDPLQQRPSSAPPGAAYHAETTQVSSVSHATSRGTDPAPMERRHSLVLMAPAIPREPLLRKGGLWMALLIGAGLAALILLR